MLIVKTILLCITVYIICFAAGSLFEGKTVKESLGMKLCLGLMLSWGILYVIAVPIMILQALSWGTENAYAKMAVFGSNSVVLLYSIALVVITAAGLIKCAVSLKKRDKLAAPISVLGKAEMIYLSIFLALVLFQLYKAVFFAYADGDDAYYVAVSELMGNGENSLYIKNPYTGGPTSLQLRYAMAPFPLWVGYFARIFGIKATVVSHVCMPIILIPVTYIIYNMIGEKLFEANKEKKYIFLCLLAVFILFAHYSYNSAEVFLLTRTRQGKAALANIVIPLMFCFFQNLASKDEFKVNISDYIKIELVAIATMLTSVFGNILVLIMLFGLFIYSFIRRAKWKDRILVATMAIPSLVVVGVYFLM